MPREQYAGELVVLVDVLRAGTVAPLLFDRGLRGLTLSASLREARRAAGDGKLLVGERGGVPPEGFNHASSPAALRNVDFSGREAVLLADNAPRALPLVKGASDVLLASLYNSAAVADRVRKEAPERLSIVCSGFQGQEDLDDTVTAGFLAGEVARRVGEFQLEGGARLALGLLRAVPDPLEAIWLSSAGRELRRQEQAEDLAVASLVAQSERIPVLRNVEPGRFSDLYHFEAEAA